MNKEDVVQALMNAVHNCLTESELRDHFEQIVFGNHFDHPKVKLPREVGEELEAWQKNNPGATFERYMDCVIYEADGLDDTYAWYQVDKIAILADAYRYGWEAEPEAKWYVQTPKEWWAQPDAPEYMSLDQLGVVSGIGSKKLADKFTRAELKKYHLDSDIFTLVPLEEDK